MNAMETIARLCAMLKNACGIIEEQASLLIQHGIETEGGKLERERAELIRDQCTFEEGAASIGGNNRNL